MKHHLTTASDLQKEPEGMGCWVHLWPPVMKLGEDKPAHDALPEDSMKIPKYFKYSNWLCLAGQSQSIWMNINLANFIMLARPHDWMNFSSFTRIWVLAPSPFTSKPVVPRGHS